VTRYEKLVRDRIPEIIEARGGSCTVRVLDDAEYTARLVEKLGEELNEYRDDGGIEELADLVEVVRAILANKGTTWEALEALREAKRAERGGFERRLFLIVAN